MAVAQSKWADAEAKFRAVYSGTARSSVYRKRQRNQEREASMKNSKTLLHYFTPLRNQEPAATEETTEAAVQDALEEAEKDAKRCIAQNRYTNKSNKTEQMSAGQKIVLDAIYLLLRMQKIGKSELHARQEICKILGWSNYREKRLKFWTNQWIESRDLPLSLQGKHPKIKSMLVDEDIQDDIRQYLRQHPLKVNASFLKQFLENYFPAKLGLDANKTISSETCRIWLKKLGFLPKEYTQGVYIDGHERHDVVEYRRQFLQQLDSLMPQMVTVNHNDPQGPNIMPNLIGGSRPHILVTHDECIFRAHDGKKTFWTDPGQSIILPKGPGRGIMVSDFLTDIDGRLEIPELMWQFIPEHMKAENGETAQEIPNGKICRRACQIIEYGKQSQGYWGGKDVVAQVQYI